MNEILNDYVNPYLDNIDKKMFDYMQKNNSIKDTFCEYKEVIYDVEQLRKVLKKYYKQNNKPDSSRIRIAQLKKKFDIPTGTLHALDEIRKSIKM